MYAAILAQLHTMLLLVVLWALLHVLLLDVKRDVQHPQRHLAYNMHWPLNGVLC